MKFLLLIAGFLSFGAFGKTLVTYTYTKVKKPVKKTLSVEEVKQAFKRVKQSTFQAPSSRQFFQDYLRFKLGVEVAYNEKSLVKGPQVVSWIKDPLLKASFEQELYKAFAELKLKKQLHLLDKRASGLSKKALASRYNRNPEFNFHYIAIHHPLNPTAAQKKEALKRAQKVYKQIRNSKKSFLELISLTSDEKLLGTLNTNRTRAVILPAVYTTLLKLKSNKISAPIAVPSGYYLVKLNRRVPFNEANQAAIRADFFNSERTKIFNSYFNKLKRSFKIQIVNDKWIDSL